MNGTDLPQKSESTRLSVQRWWNGTQQLLSRNESDCESISSTSTSSSASSKQSRWFNPEWLIGRQHWLERVHDWGLFCVLCRKYSKRLLNLQPKRNSQKKQKPCTKVKRLVLKAPYENSHKLMESSQRSWHHTASLGSKELIMISGIQDN